MVFEISEEQCWGCGKYYKDVEVCKRCQRAKYCRRKCQKFHWVHGGILAAENWIGMGGKLGKRFRAFAERVPFVTHGLSLSLGSPAPLDESLVKDIKGFLDRHNIRCYSEHLSYCSDNGHLYDLMPIPFTDEAVHYVAGRIKYVQKILERMEKSRNY